MYSLDVGDKARIKRCLRVSFIRTGIDRERLETVSSQGSLCMCVCVLEGGSGVEWLSLRVGELLHAATTRAIPR